MAGEVHFPSGQFEALYERAGGFWFEARNRLVCWAIAKHGLANGRFLEIGCGTAYVLKGIADRFPAMSLMGAEESADGLIYARRRLPGVPFVQMDARNMPFSSEFDGVGAFDVLEHITDDVAVMGEVREALKPGGIFVITVPQHMWLWSGVDDFNFHKRRYTRKELVLKLANAGYKLLTITSYVSTLLPVLYLSRRARQKSEKVSTAQQTYSEIQLPPIQNAICDAAIRIDEAMIAAGVSLPLGGSLLVVAQKL